VFGPRASSTVLSKATTWSAIVFMCTSILLVLLSQSGTGRSVLAGDAAAQAPAPAAPAPAVPASPVPAQPVPPTGN
jgi:preprotein translocase subunit SecG